MSDDKQWIKIPTKSGIWKAKNKGDTLEGKYLNRESKPFMGRPNWKYCFASDHPVNVNGKVSFFGTDGLNSAMEDIPTGYDVRIVYKRTRRSADPQKQGFQEYDVFVNISKDDPLYKKLYPDEDTPTPAAEMNLKDDTEAKNLIENYTEIHKGNNYDKDPAAEDLIQLTESDPDIDDTMKSRVKAEVASQVKAGKIRSQGGK